MSYLDSLDLSERSALLAHDARHIGQHLMGERKLKGLPPVRPRSSSTTPPRGRACGPWPARSPRSSAVSRRRWTGVAALMREQGYEPVYEPTFRPGRLTPESMPERRSPPDEGQGFLFALRPSDRTIAYCGLPPAHAGCRDDLG